MPSEAEQIELLRGGRLDFSPVRLTVAPARKNGAQQRADAVVTVRWRDTDYRFALECKGRSTPRIVEAAMARARAIARPPQTYPMIMVPYLPEPQLKRLESEGISGIDANGNCVIQVPGELLVFRSGIPNQYPDSAPLKNVYRGDASLVARTLVRMPSDAYFEKVTDLRDQIIEWGGRIALSTVSKALKRLEDDLIIERGRNRIRVLQYDKLLDQLVSHYQRPAVQRRIVGKIDPADASLVANTAHENNVLLVATGAASAGAYASVARQPKFSFYCSDTADLFNQLSERIDVTDVFANLELLQTDDQLVYFNLTGLPYERGFPVNSALQTYLELMTGDKRDRETAALFRDAIREIKVFIPDHDSRRRWRYDD